MNILKYIIIGLLLITARIGLDYIPLEWYVNPFFSGVLFFTAIGLGFMFILCMFLEYTK